jgi:hypothetical protein
MAGKTFRAAGCLSAAFINSQGRRGPRSRLIHSNNEFSVGAVGDMGPRENAHDFVELAGSMAVAEGADYTR